MIFRVQVGGQSGTGAASTGAGSSAQQQASRKVTRMCIIIASTFTVAWVPYQLSLLVSAYGNRTNRYHFVLIIDPVETLAFLNSCVNPFVYALMWRPFRHSLLQVSRNLFNPSRGALTPEKFEYIAVLGLIRRNSN